MADELDSILAMANPFTGGRLKGTRAKIFGPTYEDAAPPVTLLGIQGQWLLVEDTLGKLILNTASIVAIRPLAPPAPAPKPEPQPVPQPEPAKIKSPKVKAASKGTR
jgi:hypothetical protein